ncbi:Amidohydrolase-like protein [marine gamma proteobacterium HTCC2143]|jgi:predicted amidohydrolase YtcJ|uniref:Amidohydrolase-like protein n=1 Tax=marine gamma proteobacterium HTCC2143 TaxID=247633 RepID=A0YG21_9GAMM|nr:Amidohydrolase-like protein [marine gamma proteobacterium HTCC2143]
MKNRRIVTVLLTALAMTLSACDQPVTQKEEAGAITAVMPTTLFVNADIITVDDSRPAAQALAIRNGRVLAVGSRQEVEAAAGQGAEVRDMQGKTIVPGLIDAHGHISLTALSNGFANVQPLPAGPISSIAQLQEVMKSWDQANPEATWLMGWGYDDSLMAEGRHPSRYDLDAISTEKPIMLTHVSGHLMACNSKCLELAGITAESEDPPGGVYQRVGDSQTPNGVLEESAIYKVFGLLPAATQAQRLALLEQAQAYYASHGITTVQDGASQLSNIADLQTLAANKKLFLDVVGFRVLSKGESIGEAFTVSSDYQDHYRVGGIKLVLDGSPQGKTAWLTEPYAHPPHGQGEDYKGYPRLDDTEVNEFISESFSRGFPVLAHANGDAAADQLVNAVTLANEALGAADRRPVMIHAQTVREDQIDQMQALGIVPSYFVAHTFYWGDWHRDSVFGAERASRISPLQSTVKRNMPYTTHNDTPIVPPDMMRLLWSGVNRVTRSGKILGSDQRITPLEALKSMTINAAYQFFEENDKGSIEVGKLADLTVLSANPLKVDAMTIKDIRIEETIKEGKTVYFR